MPSFSEGHYSQRSAEVTYPPPTGMPRMDPSPRRPPSLIMGPSPRRPPSLIMDPSPRRPPSPIRPPSPLWPPSPPTEMTYMPSFPETHYRPVEPTYSMLPSSPRTHSETHYSQPLIYQASPSFSDSQRPIEATYYLSPKKPSISKSRPARRPVEATMIQGTNVPSSPRRPPSLIMDPSPRRPPSLIMDPSTRRPPSLIMDPSPKKPSISKSRPARRPVEATMIQGTNVNIGHANLNMSTTQINEPPQKVDGAYLVPGKS